MTEALNRLAERTRALLDDLEAARGDTLDVNRALKQVLRNQVAILEALAGLKQPGAGLAISVHATRPGAAAPATAAAPAATAASHAPEHGSNGNGVVGKPVEPVGAWSASDAKTRRADDDAQAAAPATSAAAEGAATAAAPATAAPAMSMAEQILQESRVLPGALARVVVEEFDNRDKSYEKGLDKLNRWVAGGAGTPFQWRGDRAYLNVNGAGPQSVKNYEEQLMSRMGFSRRLGRLVIPGLQGEIIIYERPS